VEKAEESFKSNLLRMTVFTETLLLGNVGRETVMT